MRREPLNLRIVVLHAEPAQCAALCDFISDEVGFHVVGGVAGGEELLRLLAIVPTHILVLDLSSVGSEAPALLAGVRAASPGSAILLVADGQSPAELEDLMTHGATGYLASARAAHELTAALRTVGMGRRYRPGGAPAPA
jgi:DNA-binding NarL/FixJ family response regulator